MCFSPGSLIAVVAISFAVWRSIFSVTRFAFHKVYLLSGYHGLCIKVKSGIARVYRGHDHRLGHDSPWSITGAHGDSVQAIALSVPKGLALGLRKSTLVFLSVHPRREPRVQGKNSLRVPPAFLAGWSSGPHLRVHLRPGPSPSLRHYLGHRLSRSLCVRCVSPQTQPRHSPLLRRGVRGAAWVFRYTFAVAYTVRLLGRAVCRVAP